MVQKQMINSINLVTPSPASEEVNLFYTTAPQTKTPKISLNLTV